MRVTTFAMLLAAIAAASPLQAQQARSNTRGLLIGLNVTGANAKVEDGDREAGGGGGITVGWGVSRMVAIFLRGDIAKIDISDPDIEGSYSVGIADLGVRISFREPEDRFIPYITAALSAQRGTAEIFLTPTISSDIEISGPGFTLGGGFSHFLTEQLALDVHLLLTSGRLTEIQIGSITGEISELDTQAARLNVGIAWFPVLPR
jgi:opacity protein-like surface antigen